MSFIPPYTTTLIFDIGTKHTLIGYAGDFHPTYFISTPQSIHSEMAETICKIIETYVKMTMTDSIVILEPNNFQEECKLKILSFLFSNKLVQSLVFLNSRVAETFGAGKTTASILNCSFSSISSALVINGKLTELQTYEDGANFIKTQLTEQIKNLGKKSTMLSEIFEENIDLESDRILYSLLESPEKINLLNQEYKIDLFKISKVNILKAIDTINESRVQNCMNKKNTLTSCIILTGGLFKYEAFYEFVKSSLIEKIGADFNDFILRDKDLIYSFVGASLFGMNNHAKPMYITAHDWKSIGSEIIKIKGF